VTGEQQLTSRPVVFGEVLFDVFPGNRKVLGGAPFNVAWHLQGFGLSPLLISRVGDDACGRKVIGAMREWGMDTSLIQTDTTHPTGEVHIKIEDGEPAFKIVDQQAYDYIEEPALETGGHTLLYHGTLATRHARTRNSLYDLRRHSNMLPFLDINLRDPWWSTETATEMLANAYRVKLNHHELLRLCKRQPEAATGSDPEALSSLAQTFIEQHNIGALWLTCGADGAAVISKNDEPLWALAQPVTEIKDTVGAGDGFTAIAILGLYRNWCAKETLERAQSFAAAICGMNGATTSDPAIYQQFSQEWEISHD